MSSDEQNTAISWQDWERYEAWAVLQPRATDGSVEARIKASLRADAPPPTKPYSPAG